MIFALTELSFLDSAGLQVLLAATCRAVVAFIVITAVEAVGRRIQQPT
nr:hypothetical protein [Nonomuraea basaltis]